MLIQIRQFIADIIKGGINLIFPPLCFNCNEKLADNEKVICDKCWCKIPLSTQELLAKKEQGKFIDALDCLWIFDDNFQNIVHLLKYSNCNTIGLKIGQEMGKQLLQKFDLEIDESVIVPVPLHPVKYRERGYNQSKLIADGISQITGVAIDHESIKRIKNTATQTKMNKTERVENMKNAFQLIQPIHKKYIIIVDDVYTTGTTINSVAEVIKKENSFTQIFAYTAAMPQS